MKPRDLNIEPRSPDLQSISSPIPWESGYSGIGPNLPDPRDPPPELLPLDSLGFTPPAASRPTPAGRQGLYRLENRRHHLGPTISPHYQEHLVPPPGHRASIWKPETTDISHAPHAPLRPPPATPPRPPSSRTRGRLSAPIHRARMPRWGASHAQPCKAQRPVLGVYDECRTGTDHYLCKSRAGVGQAAIQGPAGKARQAERRTQELAEAGAGLLLGRPGLALGPWPPSPGLCACARQAAARSSGAAVVPAATRRLGVWAIHGQQRGPR